MVSDVVPAPVTVQLAHVVVTVAEFEVDTLAITLEKPIEPGSVTVKSGSAAFVVEPMVTEVDPVIPGYEGVPPAA
jgi:hypothetical protein